VGLSNQKTEQISAKVIAHSKSAVNGKEIITFELEFPRIILAEFNTHNALSKNSSSSRAIPVQKMLEQVRNNPAMPVRFGRANKGMQDAGEHNDLVIVSDELAESWGGMYPAHAWRYAANQAADLAQAFHEAGYAKQICNRLIEPFQMMKVVMTATELNNFIWLRDHPAADPTIEALAKAIKGAKENSEPVVLYPGEWHLPYVNVGRAGNGEIIYYLENDKETYGGLDEEDALTISASCCAQVSFRNLDDSIEKAYSVVEKLNLKGESDEPVHASPTEHQATPMEESGEFWDETGDYAVNLPCDPDSWQEGVTHVDREGNFWSGNFESFIQYRQLIPNNVKRG
jgi:hypothetical protein